VIRVAALLLLASSTAQAIDTPPDLRPAERIQRRFVDKKGHFSVYAGFAYLDRADFYRNPGIEVAASYYFLEPLAAEVRAAWFWSLPTDEYLNIKEATGYIPDTRPSRASVLGGLRFSLGYAKLRMTATRTLHFEPQLFAYGGVHITSGTFAATGVAPLGLLGLGFLVHLTPHIQTRVDFGVTVGGEQRSTYVTVVGFLPSLSVGVRF
jgi:hypothetical protein